MTDPAHTPHEHAHEAPQAAPVAPANRRASMIANILAVAGFIILAVIIIWGLVHLARLASPWFASLFDGDSSVISVMAPVTAKSGTAFSVTWEHDANDEGMYAFSYECADGLQLGVPIPGGNYGTVPCNAPITLGDATTSIMIMPVLTATTSVPAAISVLYIERDAENSEPSAEGSATVTIETGTPKPPTPTRPATTTRPTTPSTPTTPTRPATSADLAVSVVSASTDMYGNSVVTFKIANVGGTTSGSYRFTAQLPTAYPYTYHSVAQSPLTPGSHMLNTLRFTQTVNGSFNVNVTGDAKTGNNWASRYLSAPIGYPQPHYGNPNPYPVY